MFLENTLYTMQSINNVVNLKSFLKVLFVRLKVEGIDGFYITYTRKERGLSWSGDDVIGALEK